MHNREKGTESLNKEKMFQSNVPYIIKIRWEFVTVLNAAHFPL